MTIYATPPSPHLPVWDKNGLEWEPAEGDHYERHFGSTLRAITWAELVAKHGPLTDIVLPKVGETITTTGNQYHAGDFPENVALVSETGLIAQKLGNKFSYMDGAFHPAEFLAKGEWKRIY